MRLRSGWRCNDRSLRPRFSSTKWSGGKSRKHSERGRVSLIKPIWQRWCSTFMILRDDPDWAHDCWPGPPRPFSCELSLLPTGQWHLRQAWVPLLFEDEERGEQRKHRDPVLPPQPSASVLSKKHSHQTADGLPVHSFDSLLKELGRMRSSHIRTQGAKDRGEKQSNLPPTAGTDAAADPGLRIGRAHGGCGLRNVIDNA
jgi:hypothetical protein